MAALSSRASIPAVPGSRRERCPLPVYLSVGLPLGPSFIRPRISSIRSCLEGVVASATSTIAKDAAGADLQYLIINRSKSLSSEAAPGEGFDEECLTAGATAPATPLLPSGAQPVGGGVSNHQEVGNSVDFNATTATKATSSASSVVSEANTAALSASVGTASSSCDYDVFGLVLTPEDFAEAVRVMADDDTGEGLLSPGTTAGDGVEVGGGDGETGITTPPSPSATGSTASFCMPRPEIDPLALPVGTTAALDSATWPEIPTSGLAGLHPSVDTVVPPLATDAQQADATQAAATTPPAGEEEAGPRANGEAVVDQSTLSATAKTFQPSTKTPEATLAVFELWAKRMVKVLPQVKMRAEWTNWGPSFDLLWNDTAPPAPAASSSLGPTPSVAATPAANQAGTPTNAATGASSTPALPGGLTKSEWDATMAPILALTKVEEAEDDAIDGDEEPDSRKLDNRREARHVAAAAAAAAAAPTRPRGANPWSEVDAITEGVSLWQLSGDSSPSHVKAFQASQAYIADTLTADKNIRRLDAIDQRLHYALGMLKLGDETGGEDARLERASKHADTQECLVDALKMESSDPSAAKVVPTSSKVDGAFSEWFNLLTLEAPATPHEEEARFLQRVTTQTSVREAISAMIIDKRAQDEEKKAAAAREQKMIAMELQQREAIWQARAEAQAAQAAQQAQAEREEEAKAAAAREKQRVEQQAARDREAAIRVTLAEVKRRRAILNRRTALAQAHEARDDRRSLRFPCSLHLRDMWRQGELA